MQGLGGLAPGLNRGATMSGNKGGKIADLNPVKFSRSAGLLATPVVTSFVAPAAGLYQFVGWSGGALSTGTAGSGGSLVIANARLSLGQVVPITIGSNSTAANTTTITLPDRVLTAAGGVDGAATGGIATGGDINVNGSPRVGSTGGAAASYGPFIGGTAGMHPGGGTSVGSNDSTAGEVLIIYLGP